MGVKCFSGVTVLMLHLTFALQANSRGSSRGSVMSFTWPSPSRSEDVMTTEVRVSGLELLNPVRGDFLRTGVVGDGLQFTNCSGVVGSKPVHQLRSCFDLLSQLVPGLLIQIPILISRSPLQASSLSQRSCLSLAVNLGLLLLNVQKVLVCRHTLRKLMYGVTVSVSSSIHLRQQLILCSSLSAFVEIDAAMRTLIQLMFNPRENIFVCCSISHMQQTTSPESLCPSIYS